MRNPVSTGVPGLDELLSGGFVPGSCNLVEGVPGAGKTTIGMQFIYAGALAGEPGIIVTFEQFPQQLRDDALNLGWDLSALEEQGKLRMICTSPEVFLDQLQDALGIVDLAIGETGARRLLLDSVSHLSQTSAGQGELRAMAYSMMNGLRRAGLTSVITKELESLDNQEVPVEEYLADCVVRLRYDMERDGQRRRYIEVLKSRGAPHLPGRHTLELTSQGAVVYPRHRQADREKLVWQRGLCRTSTGVSGLDDMLGGGMICGFSFLVAGGAGVGKTTLALQFICQGAASGEHGVYLALEESPTKLAALAAAYGLPLEQYQREGLIEVIHCSPLEARLEKLTSELIAAVDRSQATRVVIDSLTDLDLASPTDTGLRETVYGLVDLLESRGVTTLMTIEVPELFGQTQISGQHISIIVDGIILLKYVEVGSEIQRAVSVLKMRGSDHDKGIRRFAIGDRGICVLERFEGTEGLMAGAARVTTIELAVRSFSEFDEQLNHELLARFGQLHPNIKPVPLNIPYNPDEAREVVMGVVSAPRTSLSVAPLCMYWMPEVIRPEWLSCLSDLLPPERWADHLDGLIAPACLNNEIYAVPAITLCGVLLYRRDLLEQHGFSDPPRTWDELIHQAQTICSAPGNADLIGFEFPAYSYEGLSSTFLVHLWSNGGDVVDADGHVALASENSRQALAFLRDVMHRYGVAPQNLTTPSVGLEPRANFLAGRTVFLWMLPSVLQGSLRPESPVRGQVGIAPPPVGPLGTQAHSFLGGWHYGVPRGAVAPSAAREFIRFMTSHDIQKERALRGGPLPTLKCLYEDPEVLAFNPHYYELRQILAQARSREQIPRYSQVTAAIQRHLYPVLQGHAEPEPALAALAAEVQTLI